MSERLSYAFDPDVDVVRCHCGTEMPPPRQVLDKDELECVRCAGAVVFRVARTRGGYLDCWTRFICKHGVIAPVQAPAAGFASGDLRYVTDGCQLCRRDRA